MLKDQLVLLAREKGYYAFHTVNRESGDGWFIELCLLQKWLREKYNIHITITSISQESWQYHITKIGDVLGKNYGEDYCTYEEALEDGLQETLKLI